MKTKILKERQPVKCSICEKSLDWSAAYESSGTIICIECDPEEEQTN